MKTDQDMTLRQTASQFTPAVDFLASSVIHTDSQDIHASDTTIPSQGELLPAYIAKPAQHHGSYPVVIVVHEIFGVHEHIRDICRRLAKEGYLAIAPDLYFRQGNASEYHDISELIGQLVGKVSDRQVLVDLDHTVNWASRHDGDISKLAITGFCWGGRIAWLYAAHNPQLKAAVAWYGKLAGDKSLNCPKHPVDIAVNLSAPVLGLYGGQDSGISQEQVETMRHALRAANAEAELIVYPEAGHAFNADYRPNYHQEAALDAWQRMIGWFNRYDISPRKAP